MRLSIYTRLDSAFTLCREIRTKVFVNEYNIPVSFERDSLDYRAAHYLIRDRDNAVMGVARSYLNGDFCYIQRFALLPEYRDQGLEPIAMQMIINDCKRRYPYVPLCVYAQPEKEEFYKSLGFDFQSDTFMYAGFEVRSMVLNVQQNEKLLEQTRSEAKLLAV